MQKILEDLYWAHGTRKPKYKEEETMPAKLGNLKKTLDKQEEEFLAQIVVDKDLIAEKNLYNGFVNGVLFTVKILIEILYNDDESKN